MNAKRTTAEVTAEGMNQLNQYSVKLLNQLLPQLRGMMDKKLFTVTGEKSATLKKLVPLPDLSGKKENPDRYINYSFYFNNSNTGVWLNVRVCINGGSYDVKPNTAYTQYFDTSYYVGTLKDGKILESVQDIENIIRDHSLEVFYTEEKIQADIRAYNEAKNKARDLYNAIPYIIQKAMNVTL